MTILLLCCSANLTDFLIDMFGWETMQLLWTPLELLFDMLNAVFPNPDMWGEVWERLFT